MSDVTRRMAKRPPMSEAQVKATPSKAAMELTEKLFDQMPVMFRIQRKERVSALIQSALADLLEKAEAVISAKDMDEINITCDELAAALEPWKPK